MDLLEEVDANGEGDVDFFERRPISVFRPYSMSRVRHRRPWGAPPWIRCRSLVLDSAPAPPRLPGPRSVPWIQHWFPSRASPVPRPHQCDSLPASPARFLGTSSPPAAHSTTSMLPQIPTPVAGDEREPSWNTHVKRRTHTHKTPRVLVPQLIGVFHVLCKLK